MNEPLSINKGRYERQPAIPVSRELYFPIIIILVEKIWQTIIDDRPQDNESIAHQLNSLIEMYSVLEVTNLLIENEIVSLNNLRTFQALCRTPNFRGYFFADSAQLLAIALFSPKLSSLMHKTV